MISKIRNRMSSEKGFTLIEMLIVIIILGILLAIAVPAYLKFKDRANEGAAQANIRAMVPAMEAYNADNGALGYGSMTISTATTGLKDKYDPALKGAPAVTILSATSTTYCVRSVMGSATYYKSGPGGDISTTVCT